MMASNGSDKNISISFNEDEAIILFEWLSNFNAKETTIFEDQAEERVLFNLETSLEKAISFVFSNDYRNNVLAARERIRDKE